MRSKKIRAEVGESDPAILYLTSGATGEPKMALVTHAALTTNIDMGPQVLELTPNDCTIAFLRFRAHCAAGRNRDASHPAWAVPVWFSESLAKLPNEMKTIRPDISVGAARECGSASSPASRRRSRRKARLLERSFTAPLDWEPK